MNDQITNETTEWKWNTLNVLHKTADYGTTGSNIWEEMTQIYRPFIVNETITINMQWTQAATAIK